MDPVFNLSSRTLTQTEHDVLTKGLKYGIRDKKVDEYEILSRFEELAQHLNRHKITSTNSGKMANLNQKSTVLLQLQNLAFEFIELSKRSVDSFKSSEHQALKTLALDKTIIISKSDKGNAVVIQNVDTYKERVSQILDDSSKFVMRPKDPTITRERALITFLRKLKTKVEGGETLPRMDKRTYKAIYPTGSRAGIMYGLPKIHKEGAPLRPIISAIGTYNYGVAKHLVNILKPLQSEDIYMLKDTPEFVNNIADLTPDTDKYMVSFDVESLFTNIPTDETIEIILNRAFPDDESTRFHDLTRPELKRLLEICIRESHFQFNNKFYDQIDGVAMGSPLGPLFANIFMADFEIKHMPKLRELGIIKWYLYVDDIFSTLNSKKDAETILHYLNNQHPNIRFMNKTANCRS